MTENIIENIDGQMDLFTGEEIVVEEETTEITVDQIVKELVDTLSEPITAYKIAVVINKSFEVLGIEKTIPTQMMYNYTKNGMIVKGKKGKASDIRYTKEEVATFATKYINKYL